MLNPVMQEILSLKQRLNDVEQKLSAFTEMLSEKNRADIDYIAMETDVELDQEEVMAE